MATDISIVNRAGVEKGKITYSSNESVLELKRRISSKIRLSVDRLYLTLGSYSKTSNANRVVLDNNRKTLNEYPFKENEFIVTYKDLGPQIGWRTVFLVEYGGPLVIFLLAYFLALALNKKIETSQTLALLLVVIHYAKRELESIFVHIFSHGTMPLRNIFKNSFHYWVLGGVLIATELFFFWKNPGYSKWFQYFLAFFFLEFEFLNLQCHITLRKLRTAGGKGENTKRGIPKGWGFDLVSCANYFWETCVWATFAILVRCWTAYLFLGVSFGQMLIWALKKHRAYRKEFDGKEGRELYPRRRKAMVPFVI